MLIGKDLVKARACEDFVAVLSSERTDENKTVGILYPAVPLLARYPVPKWMMFF